MSNKDRVAGMNANNPVLYKVGEGVLGRLNLGGAGAGLNKQNENHALSSSQSNFNLLKGEGMGTYRSNLGGVDKSMDNLKLGFGSNYG